MASRIILCGASSVGKTTIATQWCAKHKQYYHVQEVARDVMREHNLTREHMEQSLKCDPKKRGILTSSEVDTKSSEST